MKTFVRMITVFCIFGLIFPEISKTSSKLDIDLYEKDVSVSRVPFRTPDSKNKISTSIYFEILEEILSLNITDFSKIKAIKEILIQGQLRSLRLIKDNCYEISDIEANLKCLENGIYGIKRSEISEVYSTIPDLLLGSCLKMESYGDEKKCYESLIFKFSDDKDKFSASQCSSIEISQEKVYCYRDLL